MASVAALHVALTLAVLVALACLAVAVHRAADTRRARALPRHSRRPHRGSVQFRSHR